MSKTCKNPNCPEVNPQPLDNFYNERASKDGKRGECKACRNVKIYTSRKANPKSYNSYMSSWRKNNPDKQHANEIKRLYGLSLEAYNSMLVQQGMKCALCDKQHDPSRKRGRLYVDHDHVTGEVRALLCADHNSMLGYAKDDIDTLKKAIGYLESHNAKRLKVAK